MMASIATIPHTNTITTVTMTMRMDTVMATTITTMTM
jgi:hypothetical protein